MALVTALFLMPTTVVISALLRLANTPPASGTLISVKRAKNRIVSETLSSPTAADKFTSEYEEISPGDEYKFAETLEQGEHTLFCAAVSNPGPSG